MIPQGEIMQHEAALELGAVEMGEKNPEAFDDLNQTFTDSALWRGVAMGLVFPGNAHAASADEMVIYARETAGENHSWLGCWCWVHLSIKDSVDFVRQGAFIALGMIQSEASPPSPTTTHTLHNKVVSDKHEDLIARFGAALSQGFIDAGGRDVTCRNRAYV
jgi:hypothetical protein